MKMGRSLNIWLTQTGESFPLDDKNQKMRTGILADHLRSRGHSVLWWGSAFDHLSKRWVFKEDSDFVVRRGLRIKAIKGIGYRKNLSFLRFLDHRIIAWKFGTLARNESKPDIIIASTPSYDLAYEAVKFARSENIPVLVDIRDEWPDSFFNFPIFTRLPLWFQRIIRLAFYHEFSMIRKTMQMANGLTAMMDAFIRWGLKYAGRARTSRDKVFYIGSQRDSSSYEIPNKIHGYTLEGKFVVTFIGTFGIYNNPGILIDCAARVSDRNILFVLAGDGDLFNEMKKRGSSLPNVILPGWLNQEEIISLLRRSRIGACPATMIREAFPNKVFTYLSAGLPIVSAWRGELKEIIEKYHIGFYFPPNDVAALEGCIKELCNNSALYEEMATNARRVFSSMFDADNIYEEFCGHIENMAGNNYINSESCL